ncbi:hypothetical protein F7725_005169 [Dissostichus mawsoni]|uniref:B30.2/SPRY domain-containing protein n=1 Tax=Dissostichus mawsoni TaxID=36200 RepID=A0A7J5YQH1_DISMA|nr:hypothetical protein F7725_005169 [Dissostichus mawsoni]
MANISARHLPPDVYFYMLVGSADNLLGLPLNSWALRLIVSGKSSLVQSELLTLNLLVMENMCSMWYFFSFVAIFCRVHSLRLMLKFYHAMSVVGRALFQCHVCVDRYLAVLHPTVFLRADGRQRVRRHVGERFADVNVMNRVFHGCGLMNVFLPEGTALYYTVAFLFLVPFLLTELFCSVSIVRVLRRPGPGQKEGNRQKKRAVNIICMVLVMLAYRECPQRLLPESSQVSPPPESSGALLPHRQHLHLLQLCGDSGARGHSVTPAQREWHSRKLGVADVELKGLISERERKVEEIHNSLREIQAAVETQTHGTVCVFSKLISSLERCQAEVLEVLERSRRAAEHRAEVLLTELQEEVSELRKRREAVSQLALTEDYSFPALSSPPPAKDWSSVSVVSELTSGAVLRTVYQMMQRVQEEIQQLPKVFQQSSEPAVPKTNPKTRKVQEYATNVILDANTAHPRLIISADGRQVQCGERHQSLPDYPERFDRVGKITVSPAHGYWFLSLRDRMEYAFRTEPSTNLTVNPRPTRVGVFVDCDKGVVSFYNVEARLLIFTFTDVFPDTIHAFFSPCTNKSGRNEAPLIICLLQCQNEM